MLVRFQPRQPIPPDGETGSCLCYKEMLRVQFLLGRPALALAGGLAGHRLPRPGAERDGGPRCIIRSAPVSDTGGPGAKPGEAANFLCPCASTNKEQTALFPPPSAVKKFSDLLG